MTPQPNEKVAIICECNCGCEPDGDWHFNEPRCACRSLACPCVIDAPGVPVEQSHSQICRSGATGAAPGVTTVGGESPPTQPSSRLSTDAPRFVLTLRWTCQACGWEAVVDAPGFAGDGHLHYPDGTHGCGPITAQKADGYPLSRDATPEVRRV